MAFDSDTRNKLARMVAHALQLLTDEFTQQLQEIYGLQPDGAIVDVEKLTHLDDEEVVTAKFLRERIGHLVSGMSTEKKPVVAAIDRAVREQAFTILNRFAALRMCEERSLVEECVRAGMQSKGFKVYETIAGSGLGDIYERYKSFLFCLFDEIAVDLGVLFDRFSPQGLLFPREQALLGILTIISNDGLSRLWTEDETIGWVYQYFNTPEERRAMREASQAPRNSRELAVRNQFFTPRYVVEFLTDNTLGRIWYEMRRGDTGIKEECRYLVWRPTEIFLVPGEKAPAEPENETDLSQEELLKQTVHITHRPKKDPRDLHVLDPACGSGHFLLYAFDLLERMYEEAWVDTESPKSEVTGRTLREDFEILDDLSRAVPKLIIEHNLHGIDIDSRAVQIAALALWLRAQKTWKSLDIKAAERPFIQRSNIVTAEPMPGEEDMRREFTVGLKPRVLGQLVDVVFDKMKLAGEAGSLLKIEEEIKDAIAEAKKQWLEGPKMEQAVLFPEIVKPKPEQQQLRFDLTGVTDERFWEQAEDCILDALKDYAERAENGHAIRRRLFAEDTAHGFAFTEICRKQFDVVLMNPPFGALASRSKLYVAGCYPSTWKDIYSAFVERGLHFVSHRAGLVGAITSSSYFNLATLEKFRELLLNNNHPLAIVDLGTGVMDGAAVSAACILVGPTNEQNIRSIIFTDAKKFSEPGAKIAEVKELLSHGVIPDLCHIVTHEALLRLPRKIFAYWLTENLIKIFSCIPRLAEQAHCSFGLHCHGHEERLYRAWWEVKSSEDFYEDWPVAKLGGDPEHFYRDSYYVVNWRNDANVLREIAKNAGGGTFVGGDYYFKEGLSYIYTGTTFSVQPLERRGVFTAAAHGLFPHNETDIWCFLSFLNSEPVRLLLKVINPNRFFQAAYVRLLPMPSLDGIRSELANIARVQIDQLREHCSRDECSRIFSTDWASREGFDDTNSPFKDAPVRAMLLAENLQSLKLRLDNLVSQTYALDEGDLTLLQSRIGPSSAAKLPGDQSFSREGELTAVISHISYAVGVSFGRWDIRMARDSSLTPDLPDPFDSPPICPPGMLTGSNGLPAESGDIMSEEWLRARLSANVLPPASSVSISKIANEDYPIRIAWNGILVDELGFSSGQLHCEDIVHRAREVLEVIWGGQASATEREACDILGVSEFRDYFRRPAGFFQDHLKRYSKSRRKAPIYWPLSTKSGAFTLWIYYHRLTDQTLYACVNDYVNPKLNNLSKDIARLQEEVAKQGSTKYRQRLEQLMDFERELKDYRDELLQVAELPYKPNLNDGVMITAAPLWKLFRHNQWRKDLETCWKKLKEGKYDWAHLAYTIWPDRVKKKCSTDLSIAIAHDLEYFYEGDDTKTRKLRGKAQG